MKTRYILAIDAGTTSTRATVYNENGTVIKMVRIKRKIYNPNVGYVEFAAVDMWEDAKNAMRRVVVEAGIDSNDICSVAITGQRESLVVCERATGNPLCRCISWNDIRTNDICEELRSDWSNVELMRKINGMLILSVTTAPKMKWVLNNVPGLREKAERGEVWMGTPDTWLIYNMTGGKEFVTENTYSTRTALINYETMSWDNELLKMFDIPRSVLTEKILPSDAYFGNMVDVFENEIPIVGIFGDQNAAAFGNLCLNTGDMRLSLGTSGNMCVNIGKEPKLSTTFTQITSLGWNFKGNTYLFETASSFCGDTINWLHDKLCVIESLAEVDDMVMSIDGTDGLRFVNSFGGFLAPKFDADAKSVVVGMSISHDKRHLVRAALESVMLELYELYLLIDEQYKIIYPGQDFNRIFIDGGVSKYTYAMQFLADILQREIVVSCDSEATSTGVFYLSGFANGFWKDVDDMLANLECKPEYKVYDPKMDTAKRDEILAEWRAALDTAYHWAELQRNQKG